MSTMAVSLELQWPGMVVSLGVALLGLLVAAARNYNNWKFAPDLPPGKKMPPGDLGWPIFGAVHHFLHYYKSGNPEGWIGSMAKRWGKLPLYRTHIFGRPMVMVTTPETAKMALCNDDLFFMHWPESTVNLIGNKSFAGISAEAHKRQKALTMRTINGYDMLTGYIPRIQEIALNTLDAWAEQDSISFLDELRTFTFNVVSSIFLSYQPGAKTARLFNSFNHLNAAIRAMPINLPGTVYHRALKSRKGIVELLQEEINERRALKPGASKPVDVLQTMMEWRDPGDGGRYLTDVELVDLTLMYLNAGHESTAHVTMWILIMMHRHPDVMRKVKEEQQAIRDAKKPGQGITVGDFRSMKYLSRVIDETLRIANISASVFRKALKDVEYNGATIPKGWSIFVNMRQIHMDPEVYPNPTKFDPDRWIDFTPKPGMFIPFGAGVHLCPGNDLAKLEMSIFIHLMVLKYDLKPLNLHAKEVYLPYHKPFDNCPVVITKKEGVKW